MSTKKKILVSLIRLVCECFFPGLGIVLGLMLSGAGVVYAARTKGCWTGGSGRAALISMDGPLFS